MRFGTVLGTLGLLLKPFGAVLLLPAALDLLDGRPYDAAAFAATAAASFLIGLVLARRRGARRDLGRIEAMAVVSLCWLLVAMLGAVPYVQQSFSPVDALFETMSGFTTTGSTIFLVDDFARVSRGLLFWRALTQWVGGMGIIVLFVAVFPVLAVAGRQMFFAEAPGPVDEALTPRIRHTASALWRLYIALTAAQATLLWAVGGMSAFDAACHSFTTLAAGGFSPHPESLAGYGAASQWICTVFMFVAGASFALQYRALRRPALLVQDPEFRAYTWIVLLSAALVAALNAVPRGQETEAALRHALFQVASVITTTGYASEDYALWEPAPLMVLGALLFIGGCAGSAGGGPKVVRIMVLGKFLAREVLFALHPRAVRVVRLGGRVIPSDTLRGIVGFLVAYMAVFAFTAMVAAVVENDLTIGITGAITTLGNTGPGFGPLGPMGTFAGLSTLTKLLFTAAMWIGRLEVMTVLVLFHPDAVRALFGRVGPAVQVPPPSPAPPPPPR
jgi:trk system potassium uptake protein TrkH